MCEEDKKKTKKDLRKFGLFGYEIGGWGSALALLLAVTGLGWQAWAYMVGPDARILPIRRVELTCSAQNGAYCEEDSNLILVVSRFAVANYGAVGYDTSIDPGAARIDFLDSANQTLKSIILTSQYFTDRTQIAFDQKSVGMIYLKAGTGLDYEIAYYPRMTISSDGKTDRNNFIKWNDFKRLLKEAEEGKKISRFRIELLPKAMGRNRYQMRQVCEILVDVRMIETSSDSDVGSFPRDCR